MKFFLYMEAVLLQVVVQHGKCHFLKKSSFNFYNRGWVLIIILTLRLRRIFKWLESNFSTKFPFNHFFIHFTMRIYVKRLTVIHFNYVIKTKENYIAYNFSHTQKSNRNHHSIIHPTISLRYTYILLNKTLIIMNRHA